MYWSQSVDKCPEQQGLYRGQKKEPSKKRGSPRNVVSKTLSHGNLTSREISLLQVRWESKYLIFNVSQMSLTECRA